MESIPVVTHLKTIEAVLNILNDIEENVVRYENQMDDKDEQIDKLLEQLYKEMTIKD